MSIGEEPTHECPGIDEEVIESYVFGSLGEGPVSRHIHTCNACQSRVAECRAYIDALKRGLKEL